MNHTPTIARLWATLFLYWPFMFYMVGECFIGSDIFHKFKDSQSEYILAVITPFVISWNYVISPYNDFIKYVWIRNTRISIYLPVNVLLIFILPFSFIWVFINFNYRVDFTGVRNTMIIFSLISFGVLQPFYYMLGKINSTSRLEKIGMMIMAWITTGLAVVIALLINWADSSSDDLFEPLGVTTLMLCSMVIVCMSEKYESL